MAINSFRGSVSEINAEKVYCTGQAYTGTTAALDLSNVTDPLNSTKKIVLGSGIVQPMLVLQGTTDFYYGFSTSSSATITSLTAIFVPAGAQEYVRPVSQTGRVYLLVLQSTAAGTCKVFVSRNSA